MQTRARLLLLTVSVVLEACGSSHDEVSEPSSSRTADLCAGGYVAGADDIVTIKACPFENQLNNVVTYGVGSASLALYDADGRQLARAVRSCDAWWQATDADGVTILARGDTGEIRAHGAVHPNMPSTRLPSFVSAPITAH